MDSFFLSDIRYLRIFGRNINEFNSFFAHALYDNNDGML